MQEELKERFKSLIRNVLDEGRDDIKVIESLEATSEDSSIEFGLSVRHNGKWLQFLFLNWDKEKIRSRDIEKMADAIRESPDNFSACIVTDKHYTSKALVALREDKWHIGNRLILARYTGSEIDELVMNRIYSEVSDARGRTGILTEDSPCPGVIFTNGHRPLNVVGLFKLLDIPIQKKYILSCPYRSPEEIEEEAKRVLIKYVHDSHLLYDSEYLLTIVKGMGLRIEYVDRGRDVLGEYNPEEKVIYLSEREHMAGTCRERFTLAHELGHHVLHKAIMEECSYRSPDTQQTLEGVGSDDKDSRYFEMQANTFATNLLLPEPFVRHEAEMMRKQLGIYKEFIYDDDQYTRGHGNENHQRALRYIKAIAERFRVSNEAARIRLLNLGLLKEKNGPQHISRYL